MIYGSTYMCHAYHPDPHIHEQVHLLWAPRLGNNHISYHNIACLEYTNWWKLMYSTLVCWRQLEHFRRTDISLCTVSVHVTVYNYFPWNIDKALCLFVQFIWLYGRTSFLHYYMSWVASFIFVGGVLLAILCEIGQGYIEPELCFVTHTLVSIFQWMDSPIWMLPIAMFHSSCRTAIFLSI